MLEEAIRQIIGADADLKFEPIYGGCIGHSYRVKAGEAVYFAKTNSHPMPSDFFTKEALGLNLLKINALNHVPEVIYAGESFLLLEWIESAKVTEYTMEHAGRALARLHLKKQPYYGLEWDNYIGSLPQCNGRYDSWPECYFHSKLWPAAQEAYHRGNLHTSVLSLLEDLYKKLPQLLPDEQPSLLHGDLWSGNLMADIEGKAYFIDPAVYYGHREVDIAMTMLFGGFTDSFYHAYNGEFPLLPDFKVRLSLYKLYPLLVHAALFGRSYQADCVHCLRIYV